MEAVEVAVVLVDAVEDRQLAVAAVVVEPAVVASWASPRWRSATSG